MTPALLCVTGVKRLPVMGQSLGQSHVRHQGAASPEAPFLWGGTLERQGRDLTEQSQAMGWAGHFPSCISWSLSMHQCLCTGRASLGTPDVSAPNLLLDQFSSQRHNLPYNTDWASHYYQTNTLTSTHRVSEINIQVGLLAGRYKPTDNNSSGLKNRTIPWQTWKRLSSLNVWKGPCKHAGSCSTGKIARNQIQH